MTIYVDLEDALSQIRFLGFHVRDIGLLEGCLARPRTTLFGADAYPTLEAKAAALIHSLATTHPLLDGNRRTSWALLVTFLLMNEREIIAQTDEAFGFILAVATDSLELEKITQWIGSRLVSSPLP